MTVQQIEAFKRENDLSADPPENGEGAPAVDFDDEIDLRAEDDALIAAELEAEKAAAEAAEAAEAARAEAEGPKDDDEADSEDKSTSSRRRGRRGRGRSSRSTSSRSSAGVLEGTFDHGEEGYGLWLDPAVEENPIYAEHWAGHRPVEVTIESDQIIIRRASVDGDDED
ncbi:hypothetical protein [Capillimicrobium parvum]|uniref:hypothetical protein n=1 Tax=Capillimicrobium parvum TaxID=2884022 RepID=UPI00216AC4DC|nr:hypothetical protein [Capillimicrobium parvum]